jgi:hypothetical protein
MDIGHAIGKVKRFYDETKKLELSFFKAHDINIILEDDAIDYIIEQAVNSDAPVDSFNQQLSRDFTLGLQLIREKTGRNRFYISRQGLTSPESFIENLVKTEISSLQAKKTD